MGTSSRCTTAALRILPILLAACGTTNGTEGEPIRDSGGDARAEEGEATDSNATDAPATDAIEPDAALDRTAPADSSGSDGGGAEGSPLDARLPEAGSSDAVSEDAGAEGGFIDARAVTFTSVYTTILAPNCLPCHAPGLGTGFNIGKLDMAMQAATYTNLVGLTGSGVAPNGVGLGSTGIT